jgi:hypothetical protein
MKVKDTATECVREARKQIPLLAPGMVRDALVEKVKQYEAEISENSCSARSGVTDVPITFHIDEC